MPAGLTGLVWLLVALLPLLLLQRHLHWEIQTIFLLLTRRFDITIILFSVLFFPGVLLHESSHWLMARLLRVRTGRFSVVPQSLPGGKLRMGYVETAAADPLSETLIGAAPLLSGGAFVAYGGLVGLGILPVWSQLMAQGGAGILAMVGHMAAQPDFWLWLYLTLVVSSTMLPSESDRRGWLPVGGVIVALLLLSLLAGAGPWLTANLAPLLDQALQAIAVVFGISALLHAILLLPTYMLRRVVERITGLQVVI